VTDTNWDDDGAAERALEAAVDDYGTRALSNPQVLSNLFKDLLPDRPRESSAMLSAAESGLADLLMERISQGVPVDAAVSMAASTLGERIALDPTACTWTSRAFAKALGYTPSAPAPGAATPPPPPASGPYATPGPTVAPPLGAHAPPPVVTPGGPFAASTIGAGGNAGFGGQPPWTPGLPGPPKPSRRPLFIASGVGGVLVLLVVLGVTMHWFDSPGPTPTTTTTSSTSSTSSTTTSSSTIYAPLSPAERTLADAFEPHGIATANCRSLRSTPAGVSIDTAVTCTNTSSPVAYVNIYEGSSTYSGTQLFYAFQSSVNFNTGQAGSTCPPPAGYNSGATTWNTGGATRGEHICYSSTDNIALHAWSYDSDNVFIVAHGTTSASLEQMQTWWVDHART